MAYQTRSRNPLLDSNMQAAIERRGKELLGMCLIGLGFAALAMFLSYTPDDPNWMVSTDAPVNNWLGRMGASVSALLFMVVGKGSWVIALTFLAWGLRFVLHRGEESAVARLVFFPIAVALASVYAATVVPDASWRQVHSFGLGGLFGDTVVGALLTGLPVATHFAVRVLSLVAGIATVVMILFVVGSSRRELAAAFRFAYLGIVMIYVGLMALLGRGASGAVATAQSLHARQKQARAERRSPPVTGEPPMHAAPAAAQPLAAAGHPASPSVERAQTRTPVTEPNPAPAPTKPGFLGALIRRPEPMPEPEMVDYAPAPDIEGMPGDDRIRSKIVNAIRQRGHRSAIEPTEAEIAERPLTKGRGRGPDPLIIAPANGLPPEPPLTAAMAAQQPGFSPVQQVQGVTPRDDAAPYVMVDDDPLFDEFEPETLPASDIPPEPEAALPLAEPDTAPSIPVFQSRKVVQNPARKAPAPSRRAQQEAQPALAFEDHAAEYELPPLSLLANPADIQRHHLSDEALEENARMLENVLDDYGVKGEIVSVRPGPVVTMYELEPAPGLKASRVIGLADDIARSMSALSARVSTVPGRSVIGIELPNENREKVVLREILASRDFGDSNMRLPLALGKDIGGDSIVANLAKMPHLLIAGTTGSGKSVAINTMILSLLYRLTPDECRLIMIDPKMLELSVYDGIPHLLSPVVTDPKKAVVALKWVVGEMEDRYRKMSKMGVRNIEGYNGRVREALAKGEMFSRTVQTGFDDDTGEPVFETEEIQPVTLPYIVVIVDEMADLMMVAGKEIEACIQRLAQMARASGIHLIMATQRPSVDVITGTIKANFPTRISFQVTSKIDSRTILGEMGAEQLLGMGDMLYMAGGAKITRCHGPFVSDEEVEEIVNHLKAFGPPDYMGSVLEGPDEEKEADIDLVLGLGGNTDGEDALYDQAVAIVIKDRKCSTSYIQRKLAIGYNKAARLVEQMEDQGLVSPANHVGKREILVPEQE